MIASRSHTGYRGVTLALVFLVAGGVRAQSPDALLRFDEGNLHYTNGEYQQAVTAYEAALQGGTASGEVYYNLGNAYYRLDKLGQAILNYERALRLMPDDRAVQHSLQLARSTAVDRFSQLPDPVWRPVWTKMVATIGPGLLAGICLLLYLGGMGLVLYRRWTRNDAPWLRRTATACLAIALPLLLATLLGSRWEAKNKQAVVMAREVDFRVAPSADADVELTIHEGLVVTKVADADGFAEVRLPNGASGWVEQVAIEII